MVKQTLLESLAEEMVASGNTDSWVKKLCLDQEPIKADDYRLDDRVLEIRNHSRQSIGLEVDSDH